MWHGYWTAGNWIVMALAMVVFWGLVVAAIVWLARPGRSTDRTTGQQSSGRRATPQQLLDERYARGELSDEEYRHRRELLGTR